MPFNNLEITEDQEYIMRKASRMVRGVLDRTESTFGVGQQTITQLQLDKFKQLVENCLYEFRDDILRQFTDPRTVKVARFKEGESA